MHGARRDPECGLKLEFYRKTPSRLLTRWRKGRNLRVLAAVCRRVSAISAPEAGERSWSWWFGEVSEAGEMFAGAIQQATIQGVIAEVSRCVSVPLRLRGAVRPGTAYVEAGESST